MGLFYITYTLTDDLQKKYFEFFTILNPKMTILSGK